MMCIIKNVLSAVIGYLLGSTTLAILIGDVFYNRDVRNEGSGNMGATNMSRSFGLAAGLWTLAWDVLKCVIAMLIGKKLAGDTGMSLAGGAAILGHAFPCFHRFKGGKCVACGAAVAFAVSWKIGLIAVAVFILGAITSRRVSIGSISAALALSVTSYFLHPGTEKMVLGIFTGLLVVVLHHANIKRILKGEEPKFTLRRD